MSFSLPRFYRDNLGYTPGSGATVGSDTIGGVDYQRVKVITGADGVNDGDVASSNPMPIAAYGELIEAIEAMRMAIQSLNRSIGMTGVDPATGRLRVLLDAITASLTLATITTVGTVTTVSTVSSVTNQAQLGGQAANSAIPSWERNTADNIRRNITVS